MSALNIPHWALQEQMIGHVSAVALTIQLRSAWRSERTWISGSVALTIAGRRIPPEDDGIDLITSSLDARALVAASNRRGRPDLDSRSAADAFDELIGKYYFSNVTTGWINRTAHVLSEIFDSAYRDGHQIAVYRQADGNDRIIWSNKIPKLRTSDAAPDPDLPRALTPPTIEQAIIPSGSLDETLLAYSAFVDDVVRDLE